MLPKPPDVRNNPQAEVRIELGKHLFFDPRLSSSRQIACASCHDPDLAWADGRTVSFGHDREPLKRNAPSLLNTGLADSFFWDGRAGSLEEQALQVLYNPSEMHSDNETITSRLRAIPGYKQLFQKAYPEQSLSPDTVSLAIAEFERTLVGGRSRFDAFLEGNTSALSDEALIGLDLFRTDARCMNCHYGPAFTDNQHHVVGLSYFGRKYEDLGRFEHTRRGPDVGAFKTPSLRNVSSTRPYMHNGLFPSLRGVLNMYNAGMPNLVPKNDEQRNNPFFPRKSRFLRPLGLNKQDLSDLEAFLISLEEPPRRIRPPVPLESASLTSTAAK